MTASDRCKAIRERLTFDEQTKFGKTEDHADLAWLLERLSIIEEAAIIRMSSGDVCKLCGGGAGYDSKLEHDSDVDGNGTPCPLHPNWKPDKALTGGGE